MRRLLCCLALAGLAACDGEPPAGASAEADTLRLGEEKFQSVCATCHGRDGLGQGIFPSLAGRPADELAARLRQYKTGHKTGNMSDTMKPFAMALSDQQIDQVSAWLAAQ